MPSDKRLTRSFGAEEADDDVEEVEEDEDEEGRQQQAFISRRPPNRRSLGLFRCGLVAINKGRRKLGLLSTIDGGGGGG